ncbi:unnamed protein product [Caenorhabditis angaria]|uniref:PDZ domain-containing protein n=1 Tax=Caenorhabditis angaria TaxID=860376 RepID=A0A9P1MW76_9PELO|nr:unnamed protein product [Caenorhabditis angaria]
MMRKSTSAYENSLYFGEEQEERVRPSSSFCEQLIVFDEEDFENENEASLIEICIDRDVQQPNGLAFRLVGSKSRGIFVSYVNPTSQQAQSLREGDRIIRCSGIPLRAISVDQAANILRNCMNRSNKLDIQIERRKNGEIEMSRRRKQAKLSMCLDQKEKNGEILRSRPATIRLTTSHSAEIFQNASNFSTSSFRGENRYPRYVSFDTQQKSLNICPTCKTQIKVPYLHQFSHNFRFLSSFSSRSSYSLL